MSVTKTLKRSNFKNLKVGQIINLEKSLVYGQKISGHFTQGHVDTTAMVKKIGFIDKSWVLRLKLRDKSLVKFIEEKASVSINGVSLTISKVTRDFFELNIIPHTLKLTNLKNLKENEYVNVELDILQNTYINILIKMSKEFSKIPSIIKDAKKGKMFILVDDKNRENEGDLVIPGSKCNSKIINFMAKHGRGLICLALTKKQIEKLKLPLMSQINKSRMQTAFTVSIEASKGISTRYFCFR